MILRSATSLRGALEGVGPENQDLFGPKKVVVLLCVRGVGRYPCSCLVWGGVQGVGGGWQAPPRASPTPSNAPSNDVASLKTIKYKRHKNNWMHARVIQIMYRFPETSLWIRCLTVLEAYLNCHFNIFHCKRNSGSLSTLADTYTRRPLPVDTSFPSQFSLMAQW